MNSYIAGEELGRGAYGRVFKAKYRGSVCAAKEVHSILIQLTQMAPEERGRLQDSFQREYPTFYWNISSSSTVVSGDDYGVDGRKPDRLCRETKHQL